MEQVTWDSSLSIPKLWRVCSLIFPWVCRINRLCLSYKWGGHWRSCLCYSTNTLRLWNFPSGIIICEWILTFYNGKAWNHTRLGHCHYSFSRFILLTVKLRSCFTICGILFFFFMYCMVYAFYSSLFERAFCLWDRERPATIFLWSSRRLCVFSLIDN